jgi:hypothetical protein
MAEAPIDRAIRAIDSALGIIRSLLDDDEPKQGVGGDVRFVCNICGIRAAGPILCTKDGCPTEMLVYGGSRKN